MNYKKNQVGNILMYLYVSWQKASQPAKVTMKMTPENSKMLRESGCYCDKELKNVSAFKDVKNDKNASFKLFLSLLKLIPWKENDALDLKKNV